MKKLVKAKVKKRRTPMPKAQTNNALHQKLSEAAKNARSRVSTYSDEKRHDLEQQARGIIKGVNTSKVCRG